jgi:hypothetical protein
MCTLPAPKQFVWIWKSSCRGKHNFFLLVASFGPTQRKKLRRKSFSLHTYHCVLCNAGVDEIVEHFLQLLF